MMTAIRESTEDYLKTILILQGRLEQVRSVDIARTLGVTKPSVSNAVKKLRGEGLVEMDANHSLRLTDAGQRYAAMVLERHTLIERFLTDVLCVDQATAHSDSCRMEHLLSMETLARIKEALCPGASQRLGDAVGHGVG